MRTRLAGGLGAAECPPPPETVAPGQRVRISAWSQRQWRAADGLSI